MVGVEANLRGKIKRDGKSGLSLAQEIAIALVGFDGGAEAGVLAHGPEAPAVHGGVNAARVGKFAGIAESGFGIAGSEILLSIQGLKRKAGERCEFLFALGGSWLSLCIRH